MKAIMLQGTASDVGKSLLCTGLCRIFYEEGVRVAPFKSQNMALNSYITADGREIGRAQGVQAEAAGIEATHDMNPVLLKPKAKMVSEVVVHGKHLTDMDAYSRPRDYVSTVLPAIGESVRRLSEQYELLVVEGAGSPVEINLRHRDVVNMRMAELLDAPVLLVADIERGGVFASIVGTLELLRPHERERVKGVIINKFRGERRLLDPGLAWLERKTEIPVLGVVPHLEIDIDPEDSLALDALRLKRQDRAAVDLDIAVIKLPKIANFTDVTPLQDEPGTDVRFVTTAEALGNPDLILIPGSKNTVEDLLWLKKRGLPEAIKERHERGSFIVGICGGFQMLGRNLSDPHHVESNHAQVSGIGLLDVETEFLPEKRTTRSRGYLQSLWPGREVEGYELHLGKTSRRQTAPFLLLDSGEYDGALTEDGRVLGTYLHGLFQNRSFTRDFLNHLRLQKGRPPVIGKVAGEKQRREESYRKLAEHLRKAIDIDRVKAIIQSSNAYRGNRSSVPNS